MSCSHIKIILVLICIIFGATAVFIHALGTSNETQFLPVIFGGSGSSEPATSTPTATNTATATEWPPLPTPGMTPSSTPSATATNTPNSICPIAFEGVVLDTQNYVWVTGDLDTTVEITDLTAGATLIGTGEMDGPYDGHACDGFVSISVNETDLIQGHVIAANSSDGSFDTIVVQEGPTPTPTTVVRDILFVVGNENNLNDFDQAILARLQNAGHFVTVESDDQTDIGDSDNMDLITISSSSSSAQVGNTFLTTTVPVLLWDPFLYDDFQMTGSITEVDLGYLPSVTNTIEIINSSHPLAGGQPIGPVIISNENLLLPWGAPNDNGVTIAEVTISDISYDVLFAYDTGALMIDDFAAPARRIGFYLQHSADPDLLTNQTWILFDTAVAWALGEN